MHDEARRLVDHDQVGVLEQDASGIGSGTTSSGSGAGTTTSIASPCAHAQRLRGDGAVDGDAAVLDQPLRLRARQLGDRRRDHRVEPAARLRGVDDDRNVAARRARRRVVSSSSVTGATRSST